MVKVEEYLVSRKIPTEAASWFKLRLGPGGILIPVYDPWGERLARLQRALDTRAKSRYTVYDGEAPNRVPYGLYNCRRYAAATGAVVVTEGPFDAIACQMAGVPCVAILGSGITESQAYLISRYSKLALVAMDRDTEGSEKPKMVKEKLVSYGLEAKIVSIPAPASDLGEVWEKVSNTKERLREWFNASCIVRP